jgi:hypothetical protein
MTERLNNVQLSKRKRWWKSKIQQPQIRMKVDIQEALLYYESEVKELEEKQKEVNAKPEYGPEE